MMRSTTADVTRRGGRSEASDLARSEGAGE
jgi:hypothetical protein